MCWCSMNRSHVAYSYRHCYSKHFMQALVAVLVLHLLALAPTFLQHFFVLARDPNVGGSYSLSIWIGCSICALLAFPAYWLMTAPLLAVHGILTGAVLSCSDYSSAMPGRKTSIFCLSCCITYSFGVEVIQDWRCACGPLLTHLWCACSYRRLGHDSRPDTGVLQRRD